MNGFRHIIFFFTELFKSTLFYPKTSSKVSEYVCLLYFDGRTAEPDFYGIKSLIPK